YRRRRLTAVRPDRLMTAERHSRAGPVGRRLGELEGRLQVPQPAEGRVRLDAELRRIAGSARLSGVAARAEADEPNPAPAQRGAHVVAAAFPRASAERDERAQRRQIASRVVAGGNRHAFGSVGPTLDGRDAGDRLGELLPARPPLPGPRVAVAV